MSRGGFFAAFPRRRPLRFSSAPNQTSLPFPAIKTTSHRSGYPVAAALLAAGLLPWTGAASRGATAPSEYWDPGHSGIVPGSDGGGTWDFTTANWLRNQNGADGTYAAGSAYFEGAAGTVSLNASGLSAIGLLFYTAGYVLQDAPGTSYAVTTGSILTSFSSGTVTISAPVNFTGSNGVFLAAGSTVALAGPVTTTVYFNAVGGTVILSGNNAITGGSFVSNGGTLQLAGTGAAQPLGGTSRVSATSAGTVLYAAGSSNQIPAATPVSLDNGTVNVNGQSQDRARALGALTLGNTAGVPSALDFGTAVSTGSVLAFGNSSAVAWSGTLNVYDYRGTPGVGGGVDQLFFGTDATGLTGTQLGEIAFYSGGAGSTLLGTGIILGNGEVTYAPVPEPATWLGATLLGVGAAAMGWRRRARR